MVIFYDKYVRKYIPEKHIGKDPGFLSFLFGTNSYQKYMEKVSKVSNELSQNNFSATHLIPHLIENYGLSLNNAREFVHRNVVHKWQHADNIEKKCMLIHSNRNVNNALENLEDASSLISENRNK